MSAVQPSPLSVKLLVEVVSDVTDWHSLGLQLNLTMSQLKDIHMTYNAYGVGRLKAEMLDLWLRSSPSASWAELIAGLTAMGEVTVANKIAARYPLTKGIRL